MHLKEMNLAASFRGNFIPLSPSSSCCDLRFQPFTVSSVVVQRRRCRLHPPLDSRYLFIDVYSMHMFVCLELVLLVSQFSFWLMVV